VGRVDSSPQQLQVQSSPAIDVGLVDSSSTLREQACADSDGEDSEIDVVTVDKVFASEDQKLAKTFNDMNFKTDTSYAIHDTIPFDHENLVEFEEKRIDTPDDDIVYACSTGNIVHYSIQGLNTTLRSAEGNQMTIKGVATIDLVIRGSKVRVDFIVIPKLPVGMILGRQFMQAAGVVLDFESLKLRITKIHVSIDLEPAQQRRIVPEHDQCVDVYVANTDYDYSSFTGFVGNSLMCTTLVRWMLKRSQ